MSSSTLPNRHLDLPEDGDGVSVNASKLPDRQITIRVFRSQDAAAFRTLNEAWIQQWFVLEPEDVEMLCDPQTHIIGRGGWIYVAVQDGDVVGCFALIPTREDALRLVRMTVRHDLRGKGVGRKLLDQAIATARVLQAAKVVLETSSKLESAVHLYESVGFRRIVPDPDEPLPLARADIYMELPLSYG